MATLISIVVVLLIVAVMVGVFVIAAAVAMFRVRSAMNAGAVALQPPVATPEDWGNSLQAILTGGDDYGTYPPHAPQKMLASSWSVTDEASAVSTLDGLAHSDSAGDALAFDRVRLCMLARASAGAGFISHERSWAYVFGAGRDLQAAFDSFSDVGGAYLRAKNAWLSERGIDTNDGTEEKVYALRNGAWYQIPFDLPLPA